jgi:hypothetical protein
VDDILSYFDPRPVLYLRIIQEIYQGKRPVDRSMMMEP